MRNVDFFYGLGSRYSYLAATQVPALERECGCRVAWRPIDSHALFARRRNPFASSPPSVQYEWPYRQKDAERWAALYGVPFREPHGRVQYDGHELALAATAAARLGKVVPFTQQLYAAVFTGSLSAVDATECRRRAEACGIAPDAFDRALADPDTAEQLERTMAEALTRGVFGVPSFVVDDEVFWGNDRLVLLRHYLGAAVRPR